MVCILSDRLYVPESFVSDEALEAFAHRFEVDDVSELVDSFGRKSVLSLGSGVAEVRTYNRVKDQNDKVYYGFSRGDVPKLGQHFGDFDWKDRTAAPVLAYPLRFTGKLMNYAEHGRGQIEAVTEWMRSKYGILKAPPRFGKTISSIYVIGQLGVKTLIIAHQEDLLKQFYQAFMEFSNVQELLDAQQGPDAMRRKKRDATGRIIGVFNDYDNPEELDVCLLCWQTFASKYGPERIRAYRDAWGLVICDEVHRSGSLKYASVLTRLNSRYRMGMTGTVERVDAHEKLIRDIIGPVMAEGKVVQIPCVVTAIRTGQTIKYSLNEPLPYLHKRIFRNDSRMGVVLRYLAQDVEDGLNICIAFHRYSVSQLVEFTETLQAMGYRAEAFYGTMRKDREAVLNSFRDGSAQIAVCNSSMLTGIDVPRWNCYYACFPNSSVVFNKQKGLSGNFYQEFSRIRTPFQYEDGRPKKFGLIRDFIDDNGFCYGSFKKRQKAYRHQGFSVVFHDAPQVFREREAHAL